MKKHLLFLSMVFLGVLLAYWNLPNSYFEQDEWHSFGNYNFLLSLKGLEFLGNLLISDFPYHFAPLSLIFKMSLYRIFALNASSYFMVSIFIHFLVSVSVYLLIMKITKIKWAALLGALFFALNSSHYQAVTWIGTFEGVEFSVLFGSLSLLSYYIYLEKRKFKFLFISAFLLLVGLLFKETALAFLLVLGLMAVATGNRNKITAGLSTVLVFVLYVLLRFAYLLFGVKAIPVSGITSGDAAALTLGYNSLTSIIKIFSQIFFPNEILVYISNITTSPFNIYQYFARGPWTLENGFRYDLLTLPLGFLLIVLMWGLSRKAKDKKGIFLGLGIVLFTLLPLLALNRYLTFLDSRYLYPATLGLSLIVGSLSARVVLAKSKTVQVIGLLSLIAILSWHLFTLKGTLNDLVKVGQMRRSIVSSIVNLYPSLPRQTIFYTESDSPFYGLSEDQKIMPFQSGFGQLLLIQYYPSEHFAVDFFRNDFLWNITDQGYKEFDDRGFGYFRDFNLMAEIFKNQKLSTENVISFAYQSKSGTLIDTTTKIRARLQLR